MISLGVFNFGAGVAMITAGVLTLDYTPVGWAVVLLGGVMIMNSIERHFPPAGV